MSPESAHVKAGGVGGWQCKQSLYTTVGGDLTKFDQTTHSRVIDLYEDKNDDGSLVGNFLIFYQGES